MSKANGRENIYREITDKIIAELDRGIVNRPGIAGGSNS
jgi:antirestriction protein ArdC